MADWKKHRFSDFVEINPSVKLNRGELYSFVEMKDLTDGNKNCYPSIEREFTGGSKFQERDTLFARITPCLENGKISQVKGLKNGKGFGSTEFYVFRGKENVSDTEFVYYLSRWSEVRDFAEMNFDGTSGRQRVPKDSFNNLFLDLPTLQEQKSIASILSSLDAKIDLLHCQNKTLEGLAETLFRKWFIEEAEESWEVGTLGEFIETTLGGEWGKENPEGDFQLQVQCIRGTDIADLETGIPERTPIRFIKQKKYESIEIKDGDLIMEISGGTDDQSTGRTAYINNEVKALFKHPLVFSNFCRLIRPKKKEYSFFLYSFIHYLYKQDELFNLENGSSGIKNLDYKSLLFSMEYKLPSLESAIKYHHDVKQYFYKINKNKSQILILTQLRDNLLPKLMSGELKIES
ncbi:MAG: restriction endonuclease subunit S [Chitinophagaceae bacterium]|jgi:type I restriction enzyme S subunit|nr:restriction endonuclease subunit S [Chitinophagaceae bacterium]